MDIIKNRIIKLYQENRIDDNALEVYFKNGLISETDLTEIKSETETQY